MKVLIFLLLAAFNTNANELTLKERLVGPLVGAHQGGSISLKGNTVPRFEYAYKLGVDIVEMDLHLTKDGVPLIFHDDNLDATTNCKGPVNEKTLEEVKKCRRFHLYELSTFEEVLQWSQGKVIINAEFKTLEVIKPALDLIKKYNAYNWVFFQAKEDRERYTIAREYDKDVALLFVVSNEESLEFVSSLEDDQLVIAEVNESSHTPYFIDALHNAHKLILEDSWHYSKTRELFKASCTELFARGIDIAISDRPKSCLKQRQKFLDKNL